MKVSHVAAGAILIAATSVTAQSCPTVNLNTVSVAKLNDPFTFTGGTKVTTKADWECRRQEILQLLDKFELGTKPPKPSSVTGSYSGTTLTVNVSNGGKSISFTATVSLPSGASTSNKVPAIIAYGALSIARPTGVAIITFNNDDIAAQQDGSSRGKGKFYDLYGSTHSAGALTAWAWGVSRIIDALETTNVGINAARIGVTGCSRNGKGALVAGALDDRVALTIPQESGSGGSACWRISDQINSSGTSTQTASEIIGENVWFSTNFNPYVNKVTTLPFDHHMLAALIATTGSTPRGLYATDNNIDWLGYKSSITCMSAAQKVFGALGDATKLGYSLVAGHSHCAWPSAQTSELQAFVNRFLLDQNVATNVFHSDSASVDNSWITWTAPTLTGSAATTTTATTTTTTTRTTTTTTTTRSTTTTGGSSDICTVYADSPETVTVTAPGQTITVTVDSNTPPPATTTTVPPSTGTCAAKYGQCGGQGFNGPTCCQSGSTCKASNQYYSQCL
ncbi:hypothetical protein HDV00_011554 [Rhizophlyctis rosea]|nr:hypothetical protein HDV00_011554 [Rhizophlyctis rosea]